MDIYLGFFNWSFETNKYLKLVHKKKNSLNNFLKPLKKFYFFVVKIIGQFIIIILQKNHNFSTTPLS